MQDMLKCTKCSLCETRSQVVPGKGWLDSKVMFVGEAPGTNEDIEGEPFVGRCGKLLDQMLVKAKIPRSKIYITNAVKCIPKKGKSVRPPTDEEIKACKGWLWKEIQEVKPKMIVTFGKVPTHLLLSYTLKKAFKLDDIAGEVFKPPYFDCIIIPCYHPAYILRNKNRIDDAQKIIDSLIGKFREYCNDNK